MRCVTLKVIKKENSIFIMSKTHVPVERVDSGEVVVFETCDCYNDQIKSEETKFSEIKGEFSNPATGPLYINDAKVGDILRIQILDIKLRDYGVMVVRPGAGVLGERFLDSKIKRIEIIDGTAVFNEKIIMNIDPMIGVIGVAPAEEEIKTTVPHLHGGNMDCKRIRRGSIVYLPVFVDGALLSLGDLHAVMGDGEIVICGLETGGEVTAQIEIIKDRKLPLPMVVDNEHFMTLASLRTLDEAGKQATFNMHDFLVNELQMDIYDAGMLLSLQGNLRICQVVDPLMTVRMELPIDILDKYNYKLP
jgi:amidase